MQPQRKFNVRFFMLMVVVSVATCIGVHFLHDYQVYRNIDTYLRRVGVSEAKGDFRDAAQNLKIYLSLRPDDFAAMSRYAMLLARDEAKASRSELERVAKMMDTILLRDRDRTDLRRRLVQIDLRLRHYSEARSHLIRLLETTPRDGELHFLLGETHDRLGDYGSAAAEFEKARQEDPSDVTAYSRLARVLRDRLKRTNEADAVMDARSASVENSEGLITKNPKSADAYVARGWYRREFGLKGASEDAARAVELAPDDFDPRLLAADVALKATANPDLKAARAHLEHAIAHHPTEWRAYTAIADVELRLRDIPGAINRLQEGVRQIPDNLYLRWTLLDLLIQAKRLDVVPAMIAEVKRLGINSDLIEYLEAEQLFAKGQWSEASKAIERTVQILTAKPDFERLYKRCLVTLGECYERLGNPDQRLVAYQRAVDLVPRGGFDQDAVTARNGLASTLISLGKIDRAIDEYRKNLLLPEATEGMRIVLARLLIFRNLRLPEASRRWEEIEGLLQSVEKVGLNSTAVTVLRAESMTAQRQLDPARKLLERARDKHPNEVDLWVALATLAVRQERVAESLPILDEAQKRLGDLVALRQARAKYWAGQGGANASDALRRLGEDLTKFTDQERFQLRTALAEARLRLGQIKEAAEIWTALSLEYPNNLMTRMLLFDSATLLGDEVAIEKAINAIQEIEGSGGVLWRFCKARILIKKAKDKQDKRAPELAQASQLLNEVLQRRPQWPRALLAVAEIDDTKENIDGALKNYQRAYDMGERSPIVIRRIVQILYQIRRYERADTILRGVQEEMPISAELQRLAADVSLQTHDYVRALELARRAISRESANYGDHVWLGQLLWSVARKDEADGRKDDAKARRAEAETSLRRGVELANNKAEAWIALIQFLSGVNNLPAAEAAIAEAEKALPANERLLPLAVANESIGRTQLAERYFKEAIELRPDDTAAIQGLASFYLKLNRHEDARPHLNRLIDLKSSDAPWARRILALAFSIEGKEALALKAIEVLNDGSDESSGSSLNELEDLRAKARVYANLRNRDRRREAIRMLEMIKQNYGARFEDRLLLAELYERDSNWTKARGQYQAAIADSPESPDGMVSFARGLLRHKEVAEAHAMVERLRPIIPKMPVFAELEARLAVLEGKPDRAILVIRDLVKVRDSQLLPCAILLEELGQHPVAEELYRRYAALAGQPLNVLNLAQFLGRRGRMADALVLCDGAWKTCPAEQVAYTSLTVLYAGVAKVEDTERVAAQIEAAIKTDPSNIALSFDLANVRVLQNRFVDAEAIFRRAYERDPKNPVSLNNLAWLLSLQEGKLSKALETIDQAISIGGSNPAFLDTRGTIHLAQGRADLAVKELEDSLAVAPDPSIAFHLSQAYFATKRVREANELLNEARNLGFKPETLLPVERKAYDQLVAALPKK